MFMPCVYIARWPLDSLEHVFEEAWAEIQALAVAEIPDVIPPRGKKQGRMILVGR